MARLILRNCQVTINAVDFSDHASSVEMKIKKDDIDVTNFGGNGREHAAGLQDNEITLNLQQDFAAASVDATLYPLWSNETEFVVAVRPVTAAKSVTNPEYSATCLLLEYQPLSGSVGELSETSVTFVIQRGTFARATS
jgi:UTP:GlnB (protein PII) uridylyltransferase